MRPARRLRSLGGIAPIHPWPAPADRAQEWRSVERFKNADHRRDLYLDLKQRRALLKAAKAAVKDLIEGAALTACRARELTLSVKPPSDPYYMRRAFTELHCFADALENSDGREWLADSDYGRISRMLRALAGNEEARRLIFEGGKRRVGRQSRTQERDYPVAFDYWIRRARAGAAHQRGLAPRDMAEVAAAWAAWEVSEPVVKRARTK